MCCHTLVCTAHVIMNVVDVWWYRLFVLYGHVVVAAGYVCVVCDVDGGVADALLEIVDGCSGACGLWWV